MEKAKKMFSSKKALSIFLTVLLLIMTLMSAGSALAASSKSLNVKSFSVSSYTDTTVTLKWKKVSGASGYVIEKYNSSKKKWTTAAKITKGSKVSYKVNKLSAAQQYKFRIRAYKKSGKKTTYSTKEKTLTTYTSPAQPKNFKMKSVSMDSVSFTWKKVSNATGYKIQQLVNGKWKTVKTVKVKTVSATINGLTSGKTYDFRIVAYKTAGQKTYTSPAAKLVVTTDEAPIIRPDSTSAPIATTKTPAKGETTAPTKPGSNNNNNSTAPTKATTAPANSTENNTNNNSTEPTKATTEPTETSRSHTNENGGLELPPVNIPTKK